MNTSRALGAGDREFESRHPDYDSGVSPAVPAHTSAHTTPENTCGGCRTPWRRIPAIEGLAVCGECAVAPPPDPDGALRAALEDLERGGRPTDAIIATAHKHWSGGHWAAYANNAQRLERGYCYITSCGADETSYFKIGKANSVHARLQTAQTDNPLEIHIEQVLPGGFYTEKLLRGMALRDGFVPPRSGRTEWFCGDVYGWLEWHEIHDADLWTLFSPDAWSWPEMAA